MRWQKHVSVVAAAAGLLVAQQPATILGVASAPKPFSLDSIQTKPEAGPVSVVEGDVVAAALTPVTFRLVGENRAVLGLGSTARIRGYRDNGSFFYLSQGSIQFDARKLPLAICARDRLYVPSIPGSGEVTIRDNAVQVKMTSGSMAGAGVEVCDSKGEPLLLQAGAGSGSASGATVTATAAAAGVSTATATATTIAVATGTAAGIAVTVAVSQPPASESSIIPGQ